MDKQIETKLFYSDIQKCKDITDFLGVEKWISTQQTPL